MIHFLRDEYGIKVSQKKFAEVANISPDRLSRIKKSGTRNVTTEFLNQILEGCWKLILESGMKVKEVNEVKDVSRGEKVDTNKEDIFRKLVRTLVDYIPDSNNRVYDDVLKLKDKKLTFLRFYLNSETLSSRVNLRSGLLTQYNQKTSLK